MKIKIISWNVKGVNDGDNWPLRRRGKISLLGELSRCLTLRIFLMLRECS